MRCRATLAYDGTAYAGFQRQGDQPTIQLMVARALEALSGKRVRIVGAGRTDAGVHASGQVIAFDLEWRHALIDLRNALNANLPPDIAVRDVKQADSKFHPRFDAVSRTYIYSAYTAPVRDPLRRHTAWHLTGTPDRKAIEDAARLLIGTHDFRSFGTPPKGENSVRTVYRAEWKSRAGRHTFTITANAFLYRMVRSIVGTLVGVGLGQVTVEEFRGILAARNRAMALPPAPPQGLTLAAVEYRD